MKCDEIFAALAMLEKERGIPQSFMMGKIIQALTTAYKRDHEGVENVIVDVNEEKKDLKMFVQKEIVEEVENPGSQISLEEAKHMSAKNELGGIVNIPVESVEFGRIAAGNGKQVIIQGLREAEHGMIYDEFNSKQHEILTGTVSLAGVSGVSSDMREITTAAKQGNEKAILSLEMYEQRITKYVGAFAAEMGGVDIIVFTGGVGEHQSSTRANVCNPLRFMGVEIDDAANDANNGDEGIISTPNSAVKVVVIPTDEEYMIAKDTEAIIEGREP